MLLRQGLKSILQLEATLNSGNFNIYLPSTGIIGMHAHIKTVLFLWRWEMSFQGFAH